MARYVLEPAVETALVRALLAENPGESHDVLAVCIWGGSEYADVARATEARVFMEALGDPWTVLQEDFAGAEDQSWFFLCLDRHAQRPTGALRVVEHGPIGFPFLRHLAEPPHELSQSRLVEGFGLDLGRLWEVGTIAVDPAYRSAAQASTTTALLYRALYAGALANNTSHLASIVVPRNLKKLHSLGIPFERMPGMPMKVFWDGAEYEPVIATIDQFDPRMRALASSLVDQASSDTRRAVASYKQQYIDALLTGRGLDTHFAYSHGPLAEIAVR